MTESNELLIEILSGWIAKPNPGCLSMNLAGEDRIFIVEFVDSRESVAASRIRRQLLEQATQNGRI